MNNITSRSSENGLRILCDWLGFTIKEDMPLKDILHLFGFDFDMFKQYDKGLYGYRKMLIHESSGLKVYFDGNKDMGVHIDVSGSALNEFLNVFKERSMIDTPLGNKALLHKLELDSTIFQEVLHIILEHGNITRLDIAIDDIGNRFYSVSDIEDLYFDNRIITKFRDHQVIKSDRNHVITGYTVQFGSRKSELMLRIYDKKLEQAKKHNRIKCDAWTRWEFEIKHNKAHQIAKKIVAGDSIIDIGMGILNEYMRVIDITDCNRSRCSMNKDWLEFIDTICRVKFVIPRKRTTIDGSIAFLERQCSRSIAKVIMALGGTEDFILHIAQYGQMRLTKEDYKQIDKYLKQSDSFNSYRGTGIGDEYDCE